MAAILQNLRNTVVAGFVLALIVFIVMGLIGKYTLGFKLEFWQLLFRYLHVASGVMWIGMLYYFNFVQMPSMPKIPDEQKPAISKVIAPTALFWFRWAAMSTIVTGLILAHLNKYLLDAILIGIPVGFGGRETMIGIGMWLGTIMWFNVWFIIWPNQKKALGLVEADADTKKKAARTAMLFSRTNTMLSVPMLFCMIAAQNPF